MMQVEEKKKEVKNKEVERTERVYDATDTRRSWSIVTYMNGLKVKEVYLRGMLVRREILEKGVRSLE